MAGFRLMDANSNHGLICRQIFVGFFSTGNFTNEVRSNIIHLEAIKTLADSFPVSFTVPADLVLGLKANFSCFLRRRGPGMCKYRLVGLPVAFLGSQRSLFGFVP